jgi:predicted RNase H-like HicB family nuclease
MIPKSGNRFPAFAKLASAGEARSDKIMLKQEMAQYVSRSRPAIALVPAMQPDYFIAMLRIETELENDGRWLAEVPALPGVLSYGATDTEARSKATALALRVIAERVENGEALPRELSGMFQLA